MSIRVLRWVFAAALTALFVPIFIHETPTIGVSARWTEGRYHFSGGTTPSALASALLVVALYVLLMYAPPPVTGSPLHGVFRRFVAFWFDFMLGMVAIAPILGVFPMLSEWRRTGVFAWNFVRATPARGDTLQATIGVLCSAIALVFYFALPLIRRRPSPGTCVLGYQVVSDEGAKMSLRAAVLRTLLGFFAGAAACLAPFAGRDRNNGKFWLDKMFGTQAVKLN